MRRVLICVAIEMEAKALARALGLTFNSDRMSASGQLQPDLAVELKIVGIRASHLPRQLDATHLTLVISAGLAGALDPALRVGDVVVDQIHSSDLVITTPAQKAAIFAQTGARAVDMETGKIRQLARSANIPFTAIRAISDRADESINPLVLSLVDPLGRPRAAVVSSTLLRRPWLIPHLIHLRANSQRALVVLARYLSDFLPGC